MRIRVGPETDFAGAIYGQVLAGGAVVALSRHDETPIQIATAVAATMVVFWIAHVYALVMSRSVVESGPIRLGDVLERERSCRLRLRSLLRFAY